MADLRDRLDDLLAGREVRPPALPLTGSRDRDLPPLPLGAGQGNDVPPLSLGEGRSDGFGPPTRPARPALADLLGGDELQITPPECAAPNRGPLACWHIRTPFEVACARQNLPPPALEFAPAFGDPPVPLDPRRTILIDIETGGFAGTPVFLIGIAALDARPGCVRQFLARTYAEEEALVHVLAELARTRDTWITFNGKSFDEPFLRERAARYRVVLPPPALHVDLLHHARRRWKAELPNCRLQTLERGVLGWVRRGDVPGSDIPDLFHHYLCTGNAAPLRPVLEHNQLDLVCCTALLQRLAAVPDPPRRTVTACRQTQPSIFPAVGLDSSLRSE